MYTDLVNLYNRNIFKTSLYIYIFQDEKCRLMRNLSLSMNQTEVKTFVLWILGSTIDLHLMQIYGFIYFIFDILWQLHPVGTNSLVKSSHIGHRVQALKGVFAKNERGYRLNAIKKRFWSLLFLLLSVASIRRNLLKTSHTE